MKEFFVFFFKKNLKWCFCFLEKKIQLRRVNASNCGDNFVIAENGATISFESCKLDNVTLPVLSTGPLRQTVEFFDVNITANQIEDESNAIVVCQLSFFFKKNIVSMIVFFFWKKVDIQYYFIVIENNVLLRLISSTLRHWTVVFVAMTTLINWFLDKLQDSKLPMFDLALDMSHMFPSHNTNQYYRNDQFICQICNSNMDQF